MTLQTDIATARNLATALDRARNELRDSEEMLKKAAPELERLERLRREVGRAKQVAYFATIRRAKTREELARLMNSTTDEQLRDSIGTVLDMDMD